jgi:hypothetical protein
VVSEATGVRRAALEHLRIARLLEANGDVIAAICAYREVVREGSSAVASEALQRITALARIH